MCELFARDRGVNLGAIKNKAKNPCDNPCAIAVSFREQLNHMHDSARLADL
jgi:hypothetical protein